MAKSFETTIGERLRVVAFVRDQLAPCWVDLRIGKWGEAEVMLTLEPEHARALAVALQKAADAAEGIEP